MIFIIILNTTLHHFAYNIQPDTLEIVIELFDMLGCKIAYRIDENARWLNFEQKPIPIDIQIIEVNNLPIDIAAKVNTHIAFLADDPSGDIKQIEKWAKEKGLQFRKGKWTEWELWFDLPNVFTNFVVEIMHKSIVD